MKPSIATLAALLVTACASAPISPSATAGGPAPRAHELLAATLWMQTSAEYRIDTRVKYAGATAMLDVALADASWTAALEQTGDASSLPPAVVMDLDETVFDNNPFQGQLVRQGGRYTPALWSQWVARAEAEALPGAVEFIRYAQSRGVAVIYITNRTASEEAATRVNLARMGVPLSDRDDTILSRGERPEWAESDKSTRRREVAARYRILLMVGDDMGDFLPSREAPEARVRLAERHGSRWGRSWILLANPAYGSWEASLYGFDTSKADAAILAEQNAWVKGF